jgi:hypothetical protein
MMVGFSGKVVKADPFIVPDFGSADFTNPLDIDNPFFTLIPGTAFCYQAETDEGTEINEVTVVTDGGLNPCTIQIAGIDTIVVRDAVKLDGNLTEDTYDFYAQDDDGNAWYLGEATNECLEPVPDNTFGTWNANFFDEVTNPNGGGIPGIVMLADPMPGNSYPQEFLEGVAEDIGKVLRLDADVTDYCDKDCLKTKEWSPLATGNVEHKYYARNIVDDIGGLVLVEALKGKNVLTELLDVVLEQTDTGACPNDFANAEALLCDSAPPTNCVF